MVGVPYPNVRSLEEELTTRLELDVKLSMCGAIRLLPPTSSWREENFILTYNALCIVKESFLRKLISLRFNNVHINFAGCKYSR